MAYKLLVVDDDKDIAESLESRLLREGYEVYVAFDGQEAVDKVKEYKPDIVLLDLMLPKLNGFEVLQQIRKTYKEKWIPVIIISAKNELESVQESYALEADHYLTKPCEIEDILTAIKTMISLIPFRIKNQ